MAGSTLTVVADTCSNVTIVGSVATRESERDEREREREGNRY